MCWGQAQIPENPQDQPCFLDLVSPTGFSERQKTWNSWICLRPLSCHLLPYLLSLGPVHILSLGQYLPVFWVVENLISRTVLDTWRQPFSKNNILQLVIVQFWKSGFLYLRYQGVITNETSHSFSCSHQICGTRRNSPKARASLQKPEQMESITLITIGKISYLWLTLPVPHLCLSPHLRL